MKKRCIERTGLHVTEPGFGGTAIGGLYHARPRDQALETLDTAWRAGIGLFDNAPLYGYGLSERILGDYLRDKQRHEYALATKVGIPLCHDRGISLIIGGVFNSGILATGLRLGTRFNYGPASREILDRVSKMQKIADVGGYPLAAAALQFALRGDFIASMLLSTRKPDSLRRNLSLFDVTEFSRFEALRVAGT